MNRHTNYGGMRTVALLLVAFWLTVISCCSQAQVTVGVHLASKHLPDKPELNDVNPGLYIRYDDWVGGVYRNSLSRTSVYAGRQIKLFGPVEATLGLITGYRTSVMPLVAVSTTLPAVGPITPRITFVPAPGARALHLSLETTF